MLRWSDGEDRRRELAVGPENYGLVRGPYKRRNVYGALLSYGPMLPPALRDPGIGFALGPVGGARLLRELGVAGEVRDPEVGYRFADGEELTLRVEGPR